MYSLAKQSWGEVEFLYSYVFSLQVLQQDPGYRVLVTTSSNRCEAPTFIGHFPPSRRRLGPAVGRHLLNQLTCRHSLSSSFTPSLALPPAQAPSKTGQSASAPKWYPMVEERKKENHH